MWERFLIAGYVIRFKMLGDVDLSLLLHIMISELSEATINLIELQIFLLTHIGRKWRMSSETHCWAFSSCLRLRGFLHVCCGRSKPSGMWSYVIVLVVPGVVNDHNTFIFRVKLPKIKDLHSFETTGTSHPTTHCHILEDLNLHFSTCENWVSHSGDWHGVVCIVW